MVSGVDVWVQVSEAGLSNVAVKRRTVVHLMVGRHGTGNRLYGNGV